MTDYAVESHPRSVVAGLVAWGRRSAWLVGWWAAGRVTVFALAGVVAAVGPDGYLRGELRHGPFGLLGAWDGIWYRRVASEGYLLVPGHQSDPAFFPLYPIMLRTVHTVGAGYTTAGILISNLAFLTALVGFHQLSRLLVGDDAARRATRYLAVFPLGYVFSMAYPESVVLALIAWAAVAALRRHWLVAAACAGAASLGRPEALFVAVPLLATAWSQRASLTPAGRGLALGAVLSPAAGLVVYPLYLGRLLGDPSAWTEAERTWGRQFAPDGFARAFTTLPEQVTQTGGTVRDVAAAVLYLALLVVALRAGAPRAWVLSGAAIVTLPVFSGTFESIGRFGLLAPAIFWGLAQLGRTQRVDRLIVVLSAVLLTATTLTVGLLFP